MLVFASERRPDGASLRCFGIRDTGHHCTGHLYLISKSTVSVETNRAEDPRSASRSEQVQDRRETLPAAGSGAGIRVTECYPVRYRFVREYGPLLTQCITMDDACPGSTRGSSDLLILDAWNLWHTEPPSALGFAQGIGRSPGQLLLLVSTRKLVTR